MAFLGATLSETPQLLPPPALPSKKLALDPFPVRPADAQSGSAFARSVAGLSDAERYEATRAQIQAGNVPTFLRALVPVTLDRPDGVSSGPHEVVVFVTPDYLSVGDDTDFLPVPLDFLTASQLADALGFVLPTTRIVDAIYAEAVLRLAPVPLPAGPQMRSVNYVLEHRALIEAERAGHPTGELVVGTKKDLVITSRLRTKPDREAIYGWHKLDGKPIQPLSLVHGVGYADYSHGIRLVDETVLVDGRPTRYLDALADPWVAPLLSREGAIPDAAELMHPHRPG